MPHNRWIKVAVVLVGALLVGLLFLSGSKSGQPAAPTSAQTK